MGTFAKPRPIVMREGGHKASPRNPEMMGYALLVHTGTAPTPEQAVEPLGQSIIRTGTATAVYWLAWRGARAT